MSRRADVPRSAAKRPVLPSAALGIVFILVAAWLLFRVPGALQEERRFEAAAACTAPAGSDECLRTVPARVGHTERAGRSRTPNFWLYVTQADGTPARTRLAGSPPSSPTAWSGSRVRVTYWQGQIRYVDFTDGRRYTYADPRGSYRLFLAGGLGLGMYGTGFLWVAYWWARHSAASRRTYPWQVGVALIGALYLAVAGAAVPWLTDDVPAALLLLAAAALPVPAAYAVTASVYRRRGDDTVHVVPAVPEAEQCVPGAVLGDVPYSPPHGGGYLVVGPGLLATTPDPTGAFARRAVPRTLVPQRVRPPYRTDPGGGNYGDRLVVECRDGGTPVFVVTAKEHVPWVLGALESAREAAREPGR
ncbi:hypothetical protein [Streptomyces gobitricini]|uniref:DUF3592 domain-containing protein n=1 Tax=Streptomyces gobitricini TaxID=68211 RepID=A0ABN3MF06_9ACTN